MIRDDLKTLRSRVTLNKVLACRSIKALHSSKDVLLDVSYFADPECVVLNRARLFSLYQPFQKQSSSRSLHFCGRVFFTLSSSRTTNATTRAIRAAHAIRHSNVKLTEARARPAARKDMALAASVRQSGHQFLKYRARNSFSFQIVSQHNVPESGVL